jgi:hypothetical protein
MIKYFEKFEKKDWSDQYDDKIFNLPAGKLKQLDISVLTLKG